MESVVLLQIAGLLHVGLTCAGLMMPRAIGLERHLKALPPLIHRLVWVYYAFIGATIVGFGLMTFLLAEPLSSGQPLARALCVFMAVFWLGRLIVSLFVFDVRPYLTRPLYRWGFRGMNVVFIYLPLVYGWVAWNGGAR